MRDMCVQLSGIRIVVSLFRNQVWLKETRMTVELTRSGQRGSFRYISMAKLQPPVFHSHINLDVVVKVFLDVIQFHNSLT